MTIPESNFIKYIERSIKSVTGNNYDQTMLSNMSMMIEFQKRNKNYDEAKQGFTFAHYCPEEQILKVMLISADYRDNGFLICN